MSKGFKYVDIDQEDFNSFISYIGQDYQAFAEHVFREKVAKVNDLMTAFEVDEQQVLEAVGSVNGKIFKKFRCAIRPIEVNSTVSESVYAFGKLVEG